MPGGGYTGSLVLQLLVSLEPLRNKKLQSILVIRGRD